MKFVFTDDRFPELRIVNDGTVKFVVLENGHEIDNFTSYEGRTKMVTEDYAGRRSRAYFDRLNENLQPGAELTLEQEQARSKAQEFESDAHQIAAALLED